jgi:hypothetical protein
MKHVWRVEGSYFQWELTVRVIPAGHPPKPITDADQSSAIVRMKRVAEHFHDTVSLHEYGLDLDWVGRRG